MNSVNDTPKKPKPNPVRELRKKIKAQYGDLYDQMTEILYRHDPAHLAWAGVPKDEYAGEVCKILPQLKTVTSAVEAQKIIFEVFDYSFNFGYSMQDLSKAVRIDNNAAGSEASYKAIAEEIWEAWERSDLLKK